MLSALRDELNVDLFTGAAVRERDRIAITRGGIPGIVLMKRAGRALLQRVLARGAGSIAVLCGKGNNAGDGYIVAGLARARGIQVQLLQVGSADDLTGDAALARDWAVDGGVLIEAFTADMAIDGELIIDALLGTGVRGAARGQFVDAINAINASSLPVIAVDLPSGLCPDSGADFGCAVRADETVTFIAAKRGLFTGAGPEHCGAIWLDDLETAQLLVHWSAAPADCRAVRWGCAAAAPLPPRRRDAHKGSSGHLLVVGGALGMGGAAILAAEAALRAGAGLVSLACAPEHAGAVLARRPEIMVRGVANEAALAPLLARATVVAVGPGLGRDDWGRALLGAVVRSGLPLIIDADALNLLAEPDNLLMSADRDFWPTNAVITPHPAEAGRILGTTTALVQADRFAAVRALAIKTNSVAVLKGAGTLIDDGEFTWLCADGNPGMAVGGMGDVLCGILGALRAQGLSAAAAAIHAVCLHARAGDLVARSGERGLLPTDVIAALPGVLNGVRNGIH